MPSGLAASQAAPAVRATWFGCVRASSASGPAQGPEAVIDR
ncbi:hypothetical protein [uncultured Pantoea sp.]|nr:hypothetical protein [uncultured Pantoea sp.]